MEQATYCSLSDEDTRSASSYSRWKLHQQLQPKPIRGVRSGSSMHSPLLASPSSGRSTPAAQPAPSVLAALSLCAATDSEASSTPPVATRVVCATQQCSSNGRSSLSLSQHAPTLNDSFTFTLTTDCDTPSPSPSPSVSVAAPAFWEDSLDEFPGRGRCSSSTSSSSSDEQSEQVEFDATTVERGCAAFVPQPIPTYTRVPSPVLPAVAVVVVAAVPAPVIIAADSTKPQLRALSVSVPPLAECDIDSPIALVSLCEFAAAAAAQSEPSPTNRCSAEMFASLRIHSSAESSARDSNSQRQQQHVTFASGLASQRRAVVSSPALAPPSAGLPRAGRSPMPKSLLPPSNRDRVRDVCFPPLVASQQCASWSSSSSSSSAVCAPSALLPVPVPPQRACPSPVAFKFSAHDVHFLGQHELLSYLPMPLMQASMICAMEAFAAADAETQPQAAAAALQQLLGCLGQLHSILGVEDSVLAFASKLVLPLTAVAAHRRLETMQMLASFIPLWLHVLHTLQALCAPAASTAASQPSDPLLSLLLLAVDRILLLLLDLTSFPRLCASIASILQGLRRAGTSASAAAEAPRIAVHDDAEASGHAAALYSDVHALLAHNGAAQSVATMLLNFAPAAVAGSGPAMSNVTHPLQRRVAERAATLWTKITGRQEARGHAQSAAAATVAT